MLSPALNDALNRLLDLTRHVLDVPTALLWLLDANQVPHLQAVRSRTTDPLPDLCAFCAAVLNGKDVLVVEVGTLPAFPYEDASVVMADAGFCAGVTVRDTDGPVGVLVVLDPRPRTLTEADYETLRQFARLAADEQALSTKSGRAYRDYLERSDTALQCYAFIPPVPADLPVAEQLQQIREQACLTEQTHQTNPGDPARSRPRISLGTAEFLTAFIASGYEAMDVETTVHDPFGQLRHIAQHAVGIVEDGYLVGMWTAQTDITERKRFEQSLTESREDALELARLKSSFLADMSHEIRTPLTSIIGFADILIEEVPEHHRELAQLIRQSGHRLMQTLNSVLDLARLEGDALNGTTVTATAERFDVVALTRQVLDLFRLQATQRGLALTLTAPDAPVFARLDAGALSRILTNLISNAIKFTPHGAVTVTVAEASEDRLEIQVADTGIGISDAFMTRIFDAFQQEGEGHPDPKGSGLGLTITKRLVTLLQGSIEVESQKGHGTVFTVRLPHRTTDR